MRMVQNSERRAQDKQATQERRGTGRRQENPSEHSEVREGGVELQGGSSDL